MKYILDVHCHTISSGHAYSTVYENAAHAASIGLTHIGVSDHGPAMPGAAHIYHFYNLHTLPPILHGVRVFRGVEANITDQHGSLDLPKEVLAKMEYVIASLHIDSFPPVDKFTNTEAMVNAMENPNVHILGHPTSSWYEVDTKAIVKAAAKTKTILEINNCSLKPNSYRYNGDDDTIEIIRLCKKYGVQMLVSSDAHFLTDVGNFGRAKELVDAENVPEELVVNTCVEKFCNAIKAKRNGACKEDHLPLNPWR